MGGQFIEDELKVLVAVPGVNACALVEAGTGLVWSACGEDWGPSVWEAASDYWRLHKRIGGHFERLGRLHVAVMHHHAGMLVLMPCVEDLDLIVACVASHRNVDWRGWQRRLAELGERIKTH